MKRLGKIYDKIADVDNIMLAFYKAKKGKSVKKDVLKYQENLMENILQLRKNLLDCNLHVGDYKRFLVFEPKKREICTVPFWERVLHHAIMNLCEDRFEQYQISASYACRRGKGVDGAIQKAYGFCQNYHWYLKLDVHKYFDSIDHETLQKIIERLFKDTRLLQLFWQIIDSYYTTYGRGIPIGNLTSQFFANLYLALLDHYIKEVLCIHGYVRYMDDFVLFANTKEELKIALEKVENFLHEKLKLELNIPQLNRCEFGLPFLGYRIFKNKIRLSQRATKRFRKKMKIALEKVEENKWTQSEFVRRIEPLYAFVDRANSDNFLLSVYRSRYRIRQHGP